MKNTIAQEVAGFLKHRNDDELSDRIPKFVRDFYSRFAGAKIDGGSLWILPATSVSTPYDILSWNEPTCWKDQFWSLIELEGIWFFGTDAFGRQFGFRETGDIFVLCIETGTLTRQNANFEEFLEEISKLDQTVTGGILYREFIEFHGAIPIEIRLFAKKPFVMGGDFVIDNLMPLKMIDGIHYYSQIANQIHALPDGSKVEIEFV